MASQLFQVTQEAKEDERQREFSQHCRKQTPKSIREGATGDGNCQSRTIQSKLWLLKLCQQLLIERQKVLFSVAAGHSRCLIQSIE